MVRRKSVGKFIERVRVLAAAGDGGNGCVSRFRDTKVAFGPANGGSGGRGGDVIVRASHNVSDLRVQSSNLNARRGGNGGSDDLFGRKGEPYELLVPVGTDVHQLGETSLSKTSQMAPADAPRRLLAELLRDGDEVIVARGGAGGRGNAAFHRGLRSSLLIAEDGVGRGLPAP